VGRCDNRRFSICYGIGADVNKCFATRSFHADPGDSLAPIARFDDPSTWPEAGPRMATEPAIRPSPICDLDLPADEDAAGACAGSVKVAGHSATSAQSGVRYDGSGSGTTASTSNSLRCSPTQLIWCRGEPAMPTVVAMPSSAKQHIGVTAMTDDGAAERSITHKPVSIQEATSTPVGFCGKCSFCTHEVEL
jgi:hypothetical protein